MKALRNLRLVGLALAGVVLAGTSAFHFILGWRWLESFYMVVTTLTTIGYQEVHPLSDTGRIVNLVIIFFGVALVFLAIGALTQALLEFELQSFFGRRRMERDISRLTDHYILCGAGRVGRSVARELASEATPFVIIEANETKAERYGSEWLVMVGDATQEQTLRDVHIERARGLVAATTTDATNLYIVLTARSLNTKLRIIARASEEDAEKHLLTAGADSVVSPYLFAGSPHRPVFPAPARGQFSRHRHHPPGNGSGDRGNLRRPRFLFRWEDDRDFAHPAGSRRHHPGHQAPGGHATSTRRPKIASNPATI